jgi:23S rRNA (cytosine1962-C5)-methyltransferase
MATVLTLQKNLRDSIKAGHPWVYDRALPARSRDLAPGQLVRLADRHGPLATGFADPGSPIRVRVLDLDSRAEVDDAWVRARAHAAARCRLSDPRLAGADGLRAIHGENDFLPGLVVDVYAGVAVILLDGDAAEALWTPHLPAVLSALGEAGLAIDRHLVRRSRRAERERAEPDRVVIREHGARFEVDVALGQKSGFFLDQRENRRLVGELAAGATLLNLFGYTGGFSIHAGLGGATRVCTVDLAAPAIEAARRNWALNDLDPAAHEAIAVDAFAFAEEAAAAGRRWDVVICDPPSFAPNERVKPRALRAYRRINALSLGAVAPGGRLLTASCSSHISEADLLSIVSAAASDARRRVRVVEVRGADRDHPVLPAFPEGRYLSALLCVVD